MKHRYIALVALCVAVLQFVPVERIEKHLLVNSLTWCGHGPEPDYILFHGYGFGLPFQWLSVGYRERCTTIIQLDMISNIAVLMLNMGIFYCILRLLRWYRLRGVDPV